MTANADATENPPLRATDEETPLLDPGTQDIHIKYSVYNRFTNTQKRIIIGLISLSGVAPLFISGSLVPSIPQIARDVETTGEVVNLAISLSIVTSALGSLLWSMYSSYYGRKPIYLLSFSILCIGSIGVASALNVPMLLSMRVLQAFGSSSGLSVGMGVIGDIYEIEQRGTASGIFFSAVLLGPTLGPFIGGVVAHHYSWRAMQYGISIFALICVVLMACFQPETSQPGVRGIDKAREKGEKDRFVFLNPLRSLGLLRSPNVFVPTVEGALVLITEYAVILPTAFTVGKKFGITNEGAIGALCIPVGLGSCIGAPLAGVVSDQVIIRARKWRGGVYVPEDRLLATLVGGGILVPCSILCLALSLRYLEGTLGLTIICLCYFMNGLGVDCVLSPLAAYFVDILHDRSAEVMAASMAFRSVSVSLCVVLLLPAFDTFGVFATYASMAVVSWVGFGSIVATIKYGDRMRAWVDLKFTISDNK
ncbi:MFS general substrate transporter [Trametopsis cervina]|nr:MFS general substrate transporter [Trametopsis cervina]